ncbi:MAG: peptide chain release factor N(5)-glutamine methyltransferase [Aquaticitalea sp.]
MRFKEVQQIFHKELDAIYGKEEVDSFFYLLTESFLEMNRLAFSLQPEFGISKAEEQPFFEALSQLKLEVPIQYILGSTEFFGLAFKVNQHTLIPRPETEELVDLVIQNSKDNSKQINILDIGTGTGCIAISLAKNVKNAKVFAMDISSEALKIAKENAALNDVNVTFIEADILNHEGWNSIQMMGEDNLHFDCIVSNPPYVRDLEKAEMKNNVLSNEPHLALFVANDNPLIFYQAITEFASKYLKAGGKLYFEINQYLGKEMVELLQNYDFENVQLKQDIFGNDRMISAIKKSCQ